MYFIVIVASSVKIYNKCYIKINSFIYLAYIQFNAYLYELKVININK